MSHGGEDLLWRGFTDERRVFLSLPRESDDAAR